MIYGVAFGFRSLYVNVDEATRKGRDRKERERKDRWEGERERRRKKQRGIKGPRNRLRKTDVLSGIRSKPSKYISWNSISKPKKKRENRERGEG